MTDFWSESGFKGGSAGWSEGSWGNIDPSLMDPKTGTTGDYGATGSGSLGSGGAWDEQVPGTKLPSFDTWWNDFKQWVTTPGAVIGEEVAKVTQKPADFGPAAQAHLPPAPAGQTASDWKSTISGTFITWTDQLRGIVEGALGTKVEQTELLIFIVLAVFLVVRLVLK